MNNEWLRSKLEFKMKRQKKADQKLKLIKLKN